MSRVEHKLVPPLLVVLACANLLSLDVAHNHRPHFAGEAATVSTSCEHGCQHAVPRTADQQPLAPHSDSPCQDDDCIACRYLAQLQVVQTCPASELEAEHVEATVVTVCVTASSPVILGHHSRAPPSRVA